MTVSSFVPQQWGEMDAMELLQQRATKVIKGAGAHGIQGESEGTRFVHPGKSWGKEGGSSCIFFHSLNKKL